MKFDLTEKQVRIILASLGDRADYYKSLDDWSLEQIEDIEEIIKLFKQAQSEEDK